MTPALLEPNWLQASEEGAKRGITTLPRTLGEAIEAFAADPLSRQVFGDAISDWETRRYLELG